MQRHKTRCGCGRLNCSNLNCSHKKKKCSPCDTDNACVPKFNRNGEWKASPLVHVAGRASRLAPSLTALRETVDPTTVNDTWYRNVADESWIAVNPKNPCNMIIHTRQDIWQGGANATVVMYTLDNGETWNEGDVSFGRMQDAAVPGSTVPPQQGGDNGDFQAPSDPAVCFDRNGNAYALTTSYNYDEFDGNFQEANVVAKSTNRGQSWNHLVATTRDDGLSSFLDKPTIHGDPFRDHTVYVVAANLLPELGLGPALVTFQKSVDGGATWNGPITAGIIGDAAGAPAQPWSTTLQVLDDANHTLIITTIQGVRPTAQGVAVGIFVMRSIDGGDTWTQSQVFGDVVSSNPFDPADPTAFIGGPGFSGRGLSVLDSAYNKQNDTLYMTWSDPRFNPNFVPAQTWKQAGVVVSKSIDGGLTWSAPVPVNPTTLGVQTFVPSIAVLDNGIVAVLFYDIRFFTGGSSLETDAWVSFFDKDLIFLEQIRVTPESFDHRQAFRFTVGDPSYTLAEYTKLASRGEDFVASFVITNPPYGVPPAPIPGAMFIYDPRPRQDVVFSRISHS